MLERHGFRPRRRSSTAAWRTLESVAQTRRIEVGPMSFSSRFFQCRRTSVPMAFSGCAPRWGRMCRRILCSIASIVDGSPLWVGHQWVAM